MTSKNNESKIVEVLKNKVFSTSPEKLRFESLGNLKSSPIFSVAPDGSGLQVEQLKDFVLKWNHFQKIVEKANQLGGIMYRGDNLPQTGAKLGDEISHDCMEGFIASELLLQKDGTSVTRRSTYYSGILAWAKIVSLHPKRDKAGNYITVNTEFRNI